MRILVLLCFACSAGFAQRPYFDFSPAAKKAYRSAISLRFDEARKALHDMASTEPENLIRIFVENELDFLTVLLDDNEKAYKRLRKNMEPRLAKIARGDSRSPYYLYTQAEIRLQWAVLRGRYGEYLTCLSDTKQAYALLEENQRRFPDFVANKKSLGMLHALVGNVPDEYRWAIKSLGGMQGNLEQGLQEVAEVLAYARKHDFVFEEETLVGYAFLLLYLGNQNESAWQTLQSARLAPRDNPLAAVALANMAIRTGRNDEAIRLLEQCPDGPAFHPFPYRDFLLGIAKTCRLDADAYVPLQRFLNRFQGGYGVKEAWQKLAWLHLLQGDESQYRSCIAQAKIRGSNRSETAVAAEREARSGEMPDPLLVRARLLFDGGYYQDAYALLQNAGNRYAAQPRLHLEYDYRMGRIAHRLGKTPEAIQFYTQTVEAGAREPWYFACNAALQLGLLHEESRDWQKARTAFQRCLGIEPQEYAASLHARAKAGLGRIKTKA